MCVCVLYHQYLIFSTLCYLYYRCYHGRKGSWRFFLFSPVVSSLLNREGRGGYHHAQKEIRIAELIWHFQVVSGPVFLCVWNHFRPLQEEVTLRSLKAGWDGRAKMTVNCVNAERKRNKGAHKQVSSLFDLHHSLLTVAGKLLGRMLLGEIECRKKRKKNNARAKTGSTQERQ